MTDAGARGGSQGFVAIPTELLRELPQRGGQRRLIVYALIHSHGNGSPRGCFAAVGTLAREAGMGERTVKRAIAELLERGWIERQLRPGHSNRYRALGSPRPVAAGSACPEPGHPGLPDHAMTQATAAPPPGPPQTPHPGHQGPPSRATTAPPPRPQEHPHPGHQGTTNKNPLTRSPEQDPDGSSRDLSCFFLSGQAADPKTQGHDPGQDQPSPAGTPPLLTPLVPPLAQPAAAGAPGPTATRLPVPISQLPVVLQPVAERIEAYWLGKPGNRSRAAFAAMVEELELVHARAGRPGVSQLLRQATQAGWALLNGEAWLAQHREELALAKHPAYQVFRAP